MYLGFFLLRLLNTLAVPTKVLKPSNLFYLLTSITHAHHTPGKSYRHHCSPTSSNSDYFRSLKCLLRSTVAFRRRATALLPYYHLRIDLHKTRGLCCHFSTSQAISTSCRETIHRRRRRTLHQVLAEGSRRSALFHTRHLMTESSRRKCGKINMSR
jgi:hypothetical protein